MSVEVVVITGPVGAGKTTTMGALAGLLADRGRTVAAIDLDSLRAVWPHDPDDPFHARLGIANLTAVWPNLAGRGVDHLLLTDVVEHPEQREQYRRAVPGAAVTVVRLEVPLPLVHDRLRRRETGGSLEWHLRRSTELHRLMAERGIGDVVLTSAGESPQQVAERIAEAVGRGPSAAGWC